MTAKVQSQETVADGELQGDWRHDELIQGKPTVVK
jgi:hypothetical protein